jgi:hypothetical protein
MANLNRIARALQLCPLLLIVLLSACRELPMSGNYRGNISFHHLPHLNERAPTPAQVGLSYHHHHLIVEVINPETQAPLMDHWTFTHKSESTLEVLIPDFAVDGGQALILRKVPTARGHCYRSPEDNAHSDNPTLAHLCFDKTSFTFSLSRADDELVHLYATQFAPQRQLKLETPQVLTVSNGVNLIMDRNYDVQEAKQSLVRANENANRAYLNLLPQVSVGGAISLGNFFYIQSYYESTRPGNDLVPFIFPGRWLLAKAATWQARAERVAFTLFKLNTGTSVQTQSIAFLNHRDLRDQIQTLQEQMTEVLAIAQHLGEQNRLDPKSILTIEITLSDLNVNLWQAQNQYMQDRLGISQTMGFENPETVQDVLLEEETTPLERIQVLDDDRLLQEKNRYAELAVNNSFELRQLEYLRKAAVLNAKNVYMNWLDVFAVMDLGANLIADIRLAKSMVKSVDINLQQTRQLLISKVYNLLRDRNLLKLSYNVLDESLVLRRDRLNLLIDQLKTYAEKGTRDDKIPVQASDIRAAVRDTAIGLTGLYNTKASLVMDQAALDRVALQGVYDQFLPHLEGIETGSN